MVSYSEIAPKCLAKIASLKHSIIKNDKKRKKEVAAQIELMEKELSKRHEEQTQQLEQSFATVQVKPPELNIGGTKKLLNGLLNETVRKPTKAQLRRVSYFFLLL